MCKEEAQGGEHRDVQGRGMEWGAQGSTEMWTEGAGEWVHVEQKGNRKTEPGKTCEV